MTPCNLLAWTPFITPAPLWPYWALLIFPLCFGVGLVYKVIRVDDLRTLPKEALAVTLWILGGMAAAAVVLVVVVKYMAS